MSVPRLSVSELPADYGDKSRYLILDLEKPIRRFVEDTADLQEHDYPVEEVLGELLIYMHLQWLDADYISDLREDMLRNFPVDGPVLVQAMERLGKSLLHQLHVCRAYTADGRMHYTIDRWLDKVTPVLVKRAELVSAALP